jgi:hypothetical protein
VSLDDFKARLARTPIPWHLARTLSWFLAVNAVVTGWDYLHTPGRTPQSLTMVEKLADLHTWGILFLAAGGTLALGLLFKRHAAVWLGHFVCFVLYVGFTVATAQAVWQFSQSRAAEMAPSIWRAVTMSLAVTVAHGILCLARGPIPRRGDEQ